MGPSFRLRQIAVAALTANAVRPITKGWGSVPAFAAGWLTTELAPHLLGLALADAAQNAVRAPKGRRAGVLGWGLTAATAAGLGYTIIESRKAGDVTRQVLSSNLGADFADNRTVEAAPIPLKQVAWPFSMSSAEVEVIRNLKYTAGGSRATMNIYRASGVDVSKAPVLLQVHGGAWIFGSKGQQGQLLIDEMARRGWVCVSINYRLATKHAFPAQIIDVKKALNWVKTNIADYGGDPNYVVITGGSAGGHLASLAALTPGLEEYQPGFEDADTSVAACVPFYGVYDLAGITQHPYATEMRDKFAGPVLLRKDPKKSIEDFRDASPLHHVSADSPDFLILHGDKDSLVNVSQGREFAKAMQQTSASSVTYVELPGAQHAFEVFGSIRSRGVIRVVADWLQWHERNNHTPPTA